MYIKTPRALYFKQLFQRLLLSTSTDSKTDYKGMRLKNDTCHPRLNTWRKHTCRGIKDASLESLWSSRSGIPPPELHNKLRQFQRQWSINAWDIIIIFLLCPGIWTKHLCLMAGVLHRRYQPWPVRNWPQGKRWASIIPNPSPPPWSLVKLSATKPVPGATKVGDRRLMGPHHSLFWWSAHSLKDDYTLYVVNAHKSSLSVERLHEYDLQAPFSQWLSSCLFPQKGNKHWFTHPRGGPLQGREQVPAVRKESLSPDSTSKQGWALGPVPNSRWTPRTHDDQVPINLIDSSPWHLGINYGKEKKNEDFINTYTKAIL